jgi:hypothetical protein
MEETVSRSVMAIAKERNFLAIIRENRLVKNRQDSVGNFVAGDV